MSNLKPVNSIVYTIAEDDETKKLSMARGLEGPNVPLHRQPLQALHLYRVTHPDGSDHYVLADSETGAKHQSTAPNTDYEVSEAMENASIAVRVPFLIRGWGSDLF